MEKNLPKFSGLDLILMQHGMTKAIKRMADSERTMEDFREYFANVDGKTFLANKHEYLSKVGHYLAQPAASEIGEKTSYNPKGLANYSKGFSLARPVFYTGVIDSTVEERQNETGNSSYGQSWSLGLGGERMTVMDTRRQMGFKKHLAARKGHIGEANPEFGYFAPFGYDN